MRHAIASGDAGRRELVRGLTRRELEIASLVATGASNKEVATRAGITERTVKSHMTNILKKLRLTSRVQLAIYMVKFSGEVRAEPE